MIAHIISIGNELLIGDTINTNATWLGKSLLGCGIRTEKVITIGDDDLLIQKALKESLDHADLTIITGGLGPTHDDITKKSLADFFGVGYKTDTQTLNFIKEMFAKRGIPFSESNNGQAEVPENCRVLHNTAGTAPGMWFEEQNHIVVSLPGVPAEMRHLMETYVLPELSKRATGGLQYYSKYYHLTGIGESTLSDVNLKDVQKHLNGNIQLAFLPGRHGITLRTSTFAKDEQEGEKELSELDHEIKTRAAEYLYSTQKGDNIASATGRLLTARKKTVAVAESCSGGFLINMLTNTPGSSSYVLGSITAYHNSVKQNILGVSESDLKTHGAVSKPVALQLAKNVAQKLGADYGLSTTGIAGPGGGTKDKPVGLIWVGFWSEKEHFALRLQLFRDRLSNKERSAIVALDVLRRRMQGIATFPYNLEAEFVD